jgi:hypothetical protein
MFSDSALELDTNRCYPQRRGGKIRDAAHPVYRYGIIASRASRMLLVGV